MRLSPPSPLSAHRLARLNAWARLWVIWVVGMCARFWDGGWRVRDLDHLARGAATLVVVNYLAQGIVYKRAKHRHGRINPMRMRTLIGALLRHAMQGRDWRGRLMAIFTAVRDLDRHVAQLTRRLRRGLSRLRVIDPAPELATRFPAAAPCPIYCNDSS